MMSLMNNSLLNSSLNNLNETLLLIIIVTLSVATLIYFLGVLEQVFKLIRLMGKQNKDNSEKEK